MPYEDLAELLSGLERCQTKVREAYIVKFGALLFSEEVPDKSDPNPFAARERIDEPDWESPQDIYGEFRRALESHPNVFHLATIGQQVELEVNGSRSGMFVEGPLLKFEVRLPKARQQFQDMDCTEQFQVISNGSYFVAFATIEDAPVYSNIAHEFRELAHEHIEKETRYKVPLFGPTPVWTNIYLAIVDADKSRSSSLESYEHEGDLYLVLEGESHLSEFMNWLFYTFRRFWGRFYDLKLNRLLAIELDVEIQNRFAVASEAASNLVIAPIWKVRMTSKLATKAALEIATLYKLVLQYDEACWSFDNQKADYLNELRDVQHLSKLQTKMAEFCRRDFRLPNQIAPALGFLEKQIDLFRNVRSLLLASLLAPLLVPSPQGF
jgi:hypothetical protein